MKETGMIFIGGAAILSNFFFWMRASFISDYDMWFCMFMAFAFPVLIIGLILLFV